HLGGSVLGPVLGLGPEGEWGTSHRDLVRHHPACALGRHGQGTRPDGAGHFWQHRHQLLLVWREYARRRIARLRFHRPSLQMAARFYAQQTRSVRSRHAARALLAELSGPDAPSPQSANPPCHRYPTWHRASRSMIAIGSWLLPIE